MASRRRSGCCDAFEADGDGWHPDAATITPVMTKTAARTPLLPAAGNAPATLRVNVGHARASGNRIMRG